MSSKTVNQIMKILFAAVIASLAMPAVVRAEDARLFEMRTYYAAPGKLDALHERFRRHTVRLVERHGIRSVGYWVPLENPDNKVIFVVAHSSPEAREESFQNFVDDPERQAAWKASEADGPLVAKREVILMRATDYSPDIQAVRETPGPTFELRAYKAAPGKLEQLHERFRRHTLDLFKKHGMTHIAYWTPVEKEQGADDTLIFIMAHESPEAHARSFASFRADPDWIAARETSEKDGPLTEKVDSLLMKPADYSPLR
jgi:heme-degrading monooxygenase HmoA